MENLSRDIGGTLKRNSAMRVVRLPPDFRKPLDASPKANWEGFAPSHRKAYVDWVAEAKRPETRARRIVQAVERISRGKGAWDSSHRGSENEVERSKAGDRHRNAREGGGPRDRRPRPRHRHRACIGPPRRRD